MDRSYSAESEKFLVRDIKKENNGINKESVNNEQTEMSAVLIIRIAPESSEQGLGYLQTGKMFRV